MTNQKELKAYLNENKLTVEDNLHKAWNALVKSDIFNNMPKKLTDSISYSLFSGGKRFRPILIIAAADAIRPDYDKQLCLDVGVGLEFIHTYSLIHDDLPAFDDDDFRRGRPTNHKMFGEATAILAGDALLTYAFEYITYKLGPKNPKMCVDIISNIARQAGGRGMIAGQSMDIIYNQEGLDKNQLENEQIYLEKMEMLKTSCLFAAALKCGGIIAGGNDVEIMALNDFGKQFGLAFQIADDLMDKDGYCAYYGEKGAKKMLANCIEKATEILNRLPGDTSTLKSLLDYQMDRVE